MHSVSRVRVSRHGFNTLERTQLASCTGTINAFVLYIMLATVDVSLKIRPESLAGLSCACTDIKIHMEFDHNLHRLRVQPSEAYIRGESDR